MPHVLINHLNNNTYAPIIKHIPDTNGDNLSYII